MSAEKIVTEYAHELEVRRGLSSHTVTAYVKEARSLLDFLAHHSDDVLGALRYLDLADLRSWLAMRQADGHTRLHGSPFGGNSQFHPVAAQKWICGCRSGSAAQIAATK